MHTLTRKELAKFGTGLRSHKVEITEAEADGSRRWLMKLQLPEHSDWFDIVTALGHVREWRELGTAIAFIQELCPHTKNVSVVLKSPNK